MSRFLRLAILVCAASRLANLLKFPFFTTSYPLLSNSMRYCFGLGGQIVQLAAKAKRGLEEILPNLDNLIEGKHSNADAVRLRACDILTDLAGSCGSRAKDCDEFKAATVTVTTHPNFISLILRAG